MLIFHQQRLAITVPTRYSVQDTARLRGEALVNLSSAGVEIITSDYTEELRLTQRTMCNFSLQHFYVNDCGEQTVLFGNTIGSGDDSGATHCLLQSSHLIYIFIIKLQVYHYIM